MATVLALAAKISADATQFPKGLTPAERALQQLDAEVVKVTAVFDKFTGSSEAAAAAQEEARGSFAALAGQLQRNQISVSQFAVEFNKLGEAVKDESEAFARAAAITESVVTPTERLRAKMAELDAQLAAGRITADTYALATKEVEREFGGLDRTLSVVEERTGKVAGVFNNVGDSFNAVSGAAEGVGAAVRTISEAGSAVVKLGFDIAQATAAFKVFRFVTQNYNVPQGILGVVLNLGKFVTVIKVAEVVAGQFGADLSGVADAATKASIVFAGFKIGGLVGLDKVLAPTITAIGTALPVALARVGIPFAATNVAAGLLSAGFTRLLAFSIPGFGQLAATAYVVAKAFTASRETADELAASVAATNEEAKRLGVTFQDLQIQKLLDAGRTSEDVAKLGLALSTIDARQLDDLALANERASKAANDSQLALGAVAATVSKTFVGAFAALSNGVASVSEGFTDIVAGVNAIADPIASVLRPFFTLIGSGVQAVLQLVGAVGSAVGAILRFTGVVLKIGLTPVIVLFNRFADTIRLGVGAAFEWFSERIEWVQGQITGLQEFFASLPFFGEAFASSQGGVFRSIEATAEETKAAVKATEEATKEAAKAAEKAQEDMTRAFERSRESLDEVIAKSAEFGQAGFDAAFQFQDALAELDRQADENELNAEQYTRGVANATAEYERQIEVIKQVQEASKKAADEAKKQREEEQRRLDTLLQPSDEADKLQNDIKFVTEQQKKAAEEINAARARGDQQEATATAARLAQLDQLRSKLEDEQAAIQQGFANGFAAAFTKTGESLSGLTEKAAKFGNEGAKAAAEIEARVAALQEKARAGIFTQAAYDAEVARDIKLFEERLARLDELRKREEQAKAAVAQAQQTAAERVDQFLSGRQGARAASEIALADEVARRRQQSAFLIEAIEQRIALEKQTLEAARENNDRRSSAAAVQRIKELEKALLVEQKIFDGRIKQIDAQRELVNQQEQFPRRQADAANQQQQAQQAYAQQQAKIFEEQQAAAAAEAERQRQRINGLNTLGTQTIAAADVRTQQGATLVVDLAAQSQDPTLIQQRLQTKFLQQIAAGVGEAASNYFNKPVAIVGYSSFQGNA